MGRERAFTRVESRGDDEDAGLGAFTCIVMLVGVGVGRGKGEAFTLQSAFTVTDHASCHYPKLPHVAPRHLCLGLSPLGQVELETGP